MAARNVLVDHNKLCKVADFGLSRSVRDTAGEMYEQRVKVRHLFTFFITYINYVYIVFLLYKGCSTHPLDGSRVAIAEHFHTKIGCVVFWRSRLGNSHIR